VTEPQQVVPMEALAPIFEKADAGAQLFFALYGLPKDKVAALFKDCSPGFMRAYMRASDAYYRGGGAQHAD
jgi:hypothetical protein